MEEDYTTMRIKRKSLFKLVELRGKLRLKNPDQVIDYLLKFIKHKEVRK